MYSTDDDDDFETYGAGEDDPETETPTRRRVGFLRGCITVVLVMALLASLFVSAFWLVRRYRDTAQSAEARATALASYHQAATPASQATVSATALPTAVTLATPTASLNRLAIVNNDGVIITMNPDGSDSRTLTPPRQIFQFPAWSPDGAYLAAIGTSRSETAVYLLTDSEDSTPHALYTSADEAPFYLYWSPDSHHLSFLASNLSDGMALHLADIEADESHVFMTGVPFYWHWTADSRQLLIHAGGAGRTAQFSLVDATAKISQTPANIASPGDFQSPGISANGRYWAYATQNGKINITDTETDTTQTFAAGGTVALSWSPSEDRLAFINSATSRNTFYGPLRLMDAVTGEVTQLTRDIVIAFFWSPDGRSIAYLTPAGHNSNDDTNAMASSRQTLGKPARQFSAPELDLIVLDATTGQGLHLLKFEPSFSFITQFIPFFDQYALSHRLWSPDSSSLVLPLRDETGNQIAIVPAHGGQPRFIGEGEMAFWSQQ